MTRILIFRRCVCFGLMLLLNACAVSQFEDNSFLTSRQALANELEDQSRYADALVQWKILGLRYPQNQMVNHSIARVSELIQKKVFKLKKSLPRKNGQGNGRANRLKALKILALQPNDPEALSLLREMEWEVAYEAASVKTAKIEERYQEKQQDTQRVDDLRRFISVAEKYHVEQDYEGLLSTADQFIRKFPKHQKAREFKYQALVNLGDDKFLNGQEEQAVAYFEQAIGVPGIDVLALRNRNNTIKRKLSLKYYREGLKSLKSNIDRSVELFQASLRFDPTSPKVKQQLLKAQRIQQNLRRINGVAN